MRRSPPAPLDPVTIPPIPLFWLLLGLLGWAPANGAFLLPRFIEDEDDERHAVYVDHYSRLDLRCLVGGGHALAPAATIRATGAGSAVAASPPVLVRLGGYHYGAAVGLLHDWHRRTVARLLFGTLRSPLLQRVGWRFPAHVLIAGARERERLVWLEAVDRALCPEGHRPARTPDGQRWSHVLVGWPVRWWVRREWQSWEDVRATLRWRQRHAAHADVPPWSRGPERLIVAREIERALSDELVQELCLDGPRLAMHLLATTDDLSRISPEYLRCFDTRLVLPGDDSRDFRRLVGDDVPVHLQRHELLLAQVMPATSASAESVPAAPAALSLATPGAGTAATRTPWVATAVGADGADASPALAPIHPLWWTDADDAPPATDGNERAVAGCGGSAAHSGGTAADGATARPTALPPVASAGSAGEQGATSAEPDGGPALEPGPASGGVPRVELRCFGGFSVWWDGHALSNGRREREWQVLGYLAIQPPAGVRRDRLVDVIWPGDGDDKKVHRLGQCLHRLRQILQRQVPGLPADAIRTTRQGVCLLDGRFLRSDAQAFLALLEQAKGAQGPERAVVLERAWRLVTGPLFQGQTWPWLDERGDDGLLPRQRFAQLWRGVVWQLARVYCRDGQVARAASVLRELLVRQPTDRPVVTECFRLYARLGDRAALDAALEAHRDALEALPLTGDWEGTAEDPREVGACARAAYAAARDLLARPRVGATGARD